MRRGPGGKSLMDEPAGVGIWARMMLISYLLVTSCNCISVHVGGASTRTTRQFHIRGSSADVGTTTPATPPDEEHVAAAPGEDAMSSTPPEEMPINHETPINTNPVIKALPEFLPIKLPPFPWWALPIPSKSALPWSNPRAGLPHFPILDNLFLLLKIAESCLNCTYFLSVDTPLLLGSSGAEHGSAGNGGTDLSPANLRLLYYQVVPFRLPADALWPLPLAFRIPSFLNGSYLLVTRCSSSFPRDNFVSLNYQRVLAPDLFLSDSMVVHGISGFLAPFTLAIPF